MSMQDLADESSTAIWTVDLLNKTIEAGEKLTKSHTVEGHLVQLKEMRSSLGRWEAKANAILHKDKG